MNVITVPPVNDPNIKRPTWSVMIPAYNCSDYLKTTIQSVLIQNIGVEEMEIWVVDDCSIDNPEEIVTELGKGRVNFYRQEKNVGQLNNFNTCLNMAKGKIIHLLHGDDLVHPGFYRSLETPMLTDNSLGAAFTGNDMIDKDGNLLYVSKFIEDKAGVIPDFVSIIASKQIIQTPSIVVKREVYETIGAFNKDLTWVEDWEMWIRIACNYKVYYVPQNLASYRMHDISNTGNSLSTGRFVQDVLKCIRTYSAYLDLPGEKKRKIIQSAKQHFLNFAINQSKINLSARILWRSFPLIYNYQSFIQLAKQIMVIQIKMLTTQLF